LRRLDWSKDPGPPKAGKFPAIFLGDILKTISCFADESGYFNIYYKQSPYYIVSFVFHDQDNDLTSDIKRLDASIADLGIESHAIHTGPLIRREVPYLNMRVEERKRVFNRLFNFTRNADITTTAIVVEKKEIDKRIDLNAHLSRQVSAFFKSNLEYFIEYDKIIVYYDNGQTELNNILVSVFNSLFENVEFRNVAPVDYKLFQAADLVCSLQLLSLKMRNKQLSKSDLSFFKSERELKRSYLSLLELKRFQLKK
jgi:hypothetical protein